MSICRCNGVQVEGVAISSREVVGIIFPRDPDMRVISPRRDLQDRVYPNRFVKPFGPQVFSVFEILQRGDQKIGGDLPSQQVTTWIYYLTMHGR